MQTASPSTSASGKLAERGAAQVALVFCVLIALFSIALYALRHFLPPRVESSSLWSEQSFDILRMVSVGIAAWLAVGGNFRELGIRRTAGRFIAIGALTPALYCSAIYGAVWATGLAPFRGLGVLAYGLGAAIKHSPVQFLAATGEELGWRGAFTPALALLIGPRAAGLVCGAAWALWHVPDILYFGFRPGGFLTYELACFSCGVIGVSVFLGWLRLRSASVWPCAIFHAAHNLLLYSCFERATESSASSVLVTGEFGLGFALAGLVLGSIGWWRLGHRARLTDLP